MFNMMSTKIPKIHFFGIDTLVPQSVHIARVSPSPVQNPSLALVKLHGIFHPFFFFSSPFPLEVSIAVQQMRMKDE